MKEVIQDLLNKKRNRYKEDYSEMLGDYKRELEISAGYNGRQILELLQNSDDEGAKNIVITLNTSKGIFSISNDGRPFSEKGYRSLFIANLSSKTSKKKYIGNKGLGFRSIITWSDEIEIISNGISLSYSQEILRTEYENLFDLNTRNTIASEEGLRPSVTPMPILSMPKIDLAVLNEYATTISLCYKSQFLTDIIAQINSITSDIFLFLRNIENIRFVGLNNKDNLSCLRELEERDPTFPEITIQQNLILNDRNWTVYGTESELPKEYSDDKKIETDLYQICIAIEENLSHSSPYLYSFFPTNIKLNQPYVLHATFDLDSTRNQINDSAKNRFILQKVVEFIVIVAKKLAQQDVSYVPLKLLHHESNADTLSIYGYYDLIKQAIEREELFPCINQTYKTLQEVVFISNDMAALLVEINATSFFEWHLKEFSSPTITQIFGRYNVDQSISVFKDYEQIVEDISKLKLSSFQRARFIKNVIQDLGANNKQGRLKLLIDSNHKLIDPDVDIYTPATSGYDLKIPSFSNIQFVEKDVYEALVSLYKPVDYESRGKSRFIYDILKGYCNIRSFEPITLAEKIIRAGNYFINSTQDNHIKVSAIKEMLSCLYYNYKGQREKSVLTIDNILCITIDGSIKSINELHLSRYYSTGKNIHIIFNNVYSDGDYIAAPIALGFSETESISDLEAFFLWLGINRFFKFETKEDKEHLGYGSMLEHRPFLSFTKRFKKLTDYYTGYTVRYRSINQIDKLFAKLNIYQIISLAHVDSEFRKQLNNIDHSDYVQLFYRVGYDIKDTPSFIKFKVMTFFKTEGFLIDDRYWWINDFQVDYENELLKKLNITRLRVNEILQNLGAIDIFNHLSINKLTDAFEKLNAYFPDGVSSQHFYKKALSHFDENQQELTKRVKLFARVNTKLQLFDQNKIYFSDNNFLPSHLSDSYPIFNFPLRAGAKKAISFFKINDLAQLKIKVLSKRENDLIQQQFIDFFEGIKPFILAYRLDDIEKTDVKQDQVLRLNNFKFKLCDEVVCKAGMTEFSLSDNNYVYGPSDKTFYFKVGVISSINELRQSPQFVDNFSETLLNVFATTSEKSHFESILRDNYNVLEYNLKKFVGDRALEEAKALLGLTSNKVIFWDIISQLANLENISNQQIDDIIPSKEWTVDYSDITNPKNLIPLKELFNKLNITIKDFNKVSQNKISTYSFNVKKLNVYLYNIEEEVKQTIWDHLFARPNEQPSLLRYFNELDKLKNNYSNFKGDIEETFDVNYESIIYSLLHQQLPTIDFKKLRNQVVYRRIYVRNRKMFSEIDLVAIEQNPVIHSLLYFDNISRINKMLQVSEVNTPEKQSTSATGSQAFENHPIVTRLATNFKTRPKDYGTKKSGIYNPPSNPESKPKISGNRAEDFAYNLLVEKYTEKYVTHKSKETEWEHYDIKYSNDNGKNWIYVDVKSTISDRFTITAWERKFGEDNSDCYDIWVYHNNEFIIFEKFYQKQPILNPVEFEVIFIDN